MYQIQKVKTWKGLRWAVTEEFSRLVEKDGKTVSLTERFPVEYKDSSKRTHVAVFPLTNDGFLQAKELKAKLK